MRLTMKITTITVLCVVAIATAAPPGGRSYPSGPSYPSYEGQDGGRLRPPSHLDGNHGYPSYPGAPYGSGPKPSYNPSGSKPSGGYPSSGSKHPGGHHHHQGGHYHDGYHPYDGQPPKIHIPPHRSPPSGGKHHDGYYSPPSHTSGHASSGGKPSGSYSPPPGGYYPTCDSKSKQQGGKQYGEKHHGEKNHGGHRHPDKEGDNQYTTRKPQGQTPPTPAQPPPTNKMPTNTPTAPASECTPATYRCSTNPKTGVPGWQVCDVSGKWVVSPPSMFPPFPCEIWRDGMADTSISTPVTVRLTRFASSTSPARARTACQTITSSLEGLTRTRGAVEVRKGASVIGVPVSCTFPLVRGESIRSNTWWVMK